MKSVIAAIQSIDYDLYAVVALDQDNQYLVRALPVEIVQNIDDVLHLSILSHQLNRIVFIHYSPAKIICDPISNFLKSSMRTACDIVGIELLDYVELTKNEIKEIYGSNVATLLVGDSLD